MIIDFKVLRSVAIELVSDSATEKPKRARGRKAAGLPDRRRAPSLVGQQIRKLKVVAEAGRNKHGHQMYYCVCSCGGKSVVTRQKLVSRDPRQWTTSCGCVKTTNFLEFHDNLAKKIPVWRRNEIFRQRLYGNDADAIAKRRKLPKATVDAVVRRKGKAVMETRWMPVIEHGVKQNHDYFSIASKTGLDPSTIGYIAKRIRQRLAAQSSTASGEDSHSHDRVA